MTDCRVMEERLSAWLDGELEPDEIALVEAHLEVCPACLRRKESFEAVDRLAGHARVHPGSGLEGRIQRALDPATPRPALRRLLSIATAALVMIALSLVILVTSDKADARRAAAQRMAAIEVMNQQDKEDQEALLKTLEWELNAMKLMITCSDEDNTEHLEKRINDLLAKVEKVRQRR
jgi:anti-sigma factor RsiW